MVKIHQRELIAEEFQSFQRVEVCRSRLFAAADFPQLLAGEIPSLILVLLLLLAQEVLGNNAPSVRGFVELGTLCNLLPLIDRELPASALVDY